MSGKGSSPRPYSVDTETFARNWDTIFSKKKKTEGERQAEAWLKDEYYDLDVARSNEETQEAKRAEHR